MGTQEASHQRKGCVNRVIPPTTQAEQVADDKERKLNTTANGLFQKIILDDFHGQWMVPNESLGSHQDKGLVNGYKLAIAYDAIKIKKSNREDGSASLKRVQKMESGRKQVEVKIFKPVRTEKEALMTIDEGQIQWYDELQSEFGDQEAALTAHKLGLKKVESQLRASHKQQISLNEKLHFQANQIFEKDEKLKKYRRIGMKAVKDKDALQKIVDSWFASSKNLWKLIDCGMSSTVKIGLGYGIQSNAEVLSYEEEMDRGIFVLKETDPGYYDIPLYSRFKQVEYKGVPHPLSGDYTPREQEDIDDSLYVYGKYGPQPQSPSPTVSNVSSISFSICPSNDSDGELGTVSGASSTPLNTQPVRSMTVMAELNSNQFTPRPVNVRPNLSTASNTIKTGRVNVNTGHGNVNSGSVHVNAGTQVKSGISRFKHSTLGREQHVNSGSGPTSGIRALEDASKQGMSIEDIEANVDVSLVDETQERQNDDLMFDSRVLEDDVMHVEAKVDGKDEQSKKPNDSTAGEAVTTASIDDIVVPTTNEEITLA
ncbi:hypothetical protein Tco_1144484 [Tanacetum coccineum]